jgi:flavin-dependent thymidylate synthase
MMKVKLAGFNVDKSLIDSIPEIQKATPEVLSAAYARISRSSKNVTELRKEALEEIDKARKSNQKIIYEMGHSSVAEHAVFNFDITGISRYLAEFVQQSRLVSFTEKSQRYVTLEGDYIVPKEIENHSCKAGYISLIEKMNSLYSEMYEIALELPEVKSIEHKREREGRAKEDARYFLPLATETQMGMTINARNLEKMLKRLDCLNFQEAHDLRTLIWKEVKDTAPSLIQYIKSEDYDLKKIFQESRIQPTEISKTRLIDYDRDIDIKILAYLLFQDRGGSIRDWVDVFEELDHAFQQRFYDKIYEGMKSYHAVPRAFEQANFTFETVMSATCFAQFKRHRIASIIRSPYQLESGYIIPPLLKNVLSEDRITSIESKIAQIYPILEEINPNITPYILMNAQKLQVVFQMNLREIYHFVRLRSDTHAQWEIRNLSNKMVELIKDKCPLASSRLMGKDQFDKQFIK